MARCVNCGAELVILKDDIRYCVYFDRHDAETRPPLCRACYRDDCGACWHCELDVAEHLPRARFTVDEPTQYPEPTYRPDEDGGEDVDA